jgi:methenyltetrahydrofolate cyclohydrolase
MSEIKDKSIQVFLDQLASKASTPGGGSAAAVMGAQSAALVSMVCNLTIGKPNYADIEADMQDLLKKSETLREQLTGMIKADVDVFNHVMDCYALPKETDAEQAVRKDKIQEALKMATNIPLQCTRACAQAVEFSRIAAEKGNVNVISDAGVAVMAAYAALKSAALNVYINVKSIRDRSFVDSTLADLEQILLDADIATEEIYQCVKGKL